MTSPDISALVERLEAVLDLLQSIASGDILFSAPNAAPGKELRFSDLRQLIASLRALEAERDDYKSDYFRRHKDACDHYERVLALQHQLTHTRERLKEALDGWERDDHLSGRDEEHIAAIRKELEPTSPSP